MSWMLQTVKGNSAKKKEKQPSIEEEEKTALPASEKYLRRSEDSQKKQRGEVQNYRSVPFWKEEEKECQSDGKDKTSSLQINLIRIETEN